ncbi:MAG: hypothetical protein ABJA87_08655 [bacterium]
MLALLVSMVLGLTACTNTQAPVNREGRSGDSTAPVVASGQQVRLEVDNSFRFHPSTITVHPGRVTITLHHRGPGAPHNWQLLGFPGDYAPTIAPGQTSTVTSSRRRPEPMSSSAPSTSDRVRPAPWWCCRSEGGAAEVRVVLPN